MVGAEGVAQGISFTGLLDEEASQLQKTALDWGASDSCIITRQGS